MLLSNDLWRHPRPMAVSGKIASVAGPPNAEFQTEIKPGMSASVAEESVNGILEITPWCGTPRNAKYALKK